MADFPPTIVIVVIFGSVVTHLWKQNARLKHEMSNLTKEEVEKFLHGTTSESVVGSPMQIDAKPYNSSFEVSQDLIEFDEQNVLGSGQFGIVFQGFVTKDEQRIPVAVKTMKKNVDQNKQEFLALLSEIKIMAYLEQHENVACLIAACTENMGKCEAFAAVEFCEVGDLLHYLRNHRESFQNLVNLPLMYPPLADEEVLEFAETKTVLTSKDLLSFASGIANGMSYLASKDVIHADIAARNILLTKCLKIKISDFGLSRKLMMDYKLYVEMSREVPLPFKWMAVEALTDLKFSLKSDVWSYGIVLYEIFSLGQAPYMGSQWNHEFVERIIKGYRIQKPQYANNHIYEMMLDCWHTDPLKRPTMSQIHENIIGNSPNIENEESC